MKCHQFFRIAFVIALVLFLTPTAAVAQNVGFTYWQSSGGGCIPTDATVESQQYWTVTGAGRVKYKGNGTQPLTFSCPVSSINPDVLGGDGTVLRLFYQDPDGAGNDFQVAARLKSFNKSNGAYEGNVCEVISDQRGSWQSSSSSCSGIDINNHLYWVETIVKRPAASDSVVEFNGVSLEGAIF
jgi:hypothetical protein